MLVSSFYANYGYNPRCTLKVSEESRILSAEDLAKHLKETHEQLRQALASVQVKYKENYDVHTKNLSDFKAGDLVWLSRRHIKSKRPSQKLDFKRLGPFKILEIVDESKLAFRLELPSRVRIHPIFHAFLLEPYHANVIAGRNQF